MKTNKVFSGWAVFLALVAVMFIGFTACDTGNGTKETLLKPAVSQYDIAGDMTQEAGVTITPITVTVKQDMVDAGTASSGAVTVWYTGTSGTTYTKSQTVPQTAGTYAVTFDVTAASGWNAANGLDAGTLTIFALQVVNGGFEDGLNGWVGEENDNISIDTTVFHTGQKSLKITDAKWQTDVNQVISVTPNTPYLVSFWGKVNRDDDGGWGCIVKIIANDKDSGPTLSAVENTIKDSDWAPYKVAFNSGTAKNIVLYIGGGDSEFYVDDLRIDRIVIDTTANLVENGDFETGALEPWGGGYDGDGRFAVVDEDKHAGTYSLKVDNTDYWSCAQTIPVTANTDYILCFWTKIVADDPDTSWDTLIKVGPDQDSPDEDLLVKAQPKSDYKVTESGVWTQVLYTLNTGDLTELVVNLSGSYNCFYYVDDVVLVPLVCK